MLLNGHELNGVIARPLDAGQHIVGKFPVAANALFFLGHAHMAFIDKERLAFGTAKVRIRPGIGRARPDLAVEAPGIGVLNHPADIQGNPVAHLAGGLGDLNLYQGKMGKRIFSGQRDFPCSVPHGPKGMALPVPMVKITDEMQGPGMRRPFPIDPTIPRPVESVI